MGSLLEFLVPLAFAQGESSPGYASFVPLILLVVIFYFLLIRPQQKRTKEHKKLLVDLNKDDEVLTSGGIVGKISNLDDNFVSLGIAPNVEVKIQKQAISQKMPKGTLDNFVPSEIAPIRTKKQKKATSQKMPKLGKS